MPDRRSKKSKIADLLARSGKYSKRKLFTAMLAGAALLGTLTYLVAQTLLFRHGETVAIVLVAPLSGPDAAQGRALMRGAQLSVDQRNKADGIAGHPIELISVDEAAGGAAVARQIGQSKAVAVIGHWSDAAADGAAEGYSAANIPALLLAGADRSGETSWVFHALSDQKQETRFLANYVRNIVGEKSVNIIAEDDARGRALADAFDETLQRFGTKVLFRWSYQPQDANRHARLEEIAKDITAKSIAGTLLILGRNADATADLVATLREGGVRNKLTGLRDLGTQAFLDDLANRWRGTGTVAAALNGTLVTTPLLFDAAGPEAQAFQSAFVERYDARPDWVAGQGFEAVGRIADLVDPALSLADGRRAIRDRLQAADRPATAVASMEGPVFFGKDGRTSTLPMVGQFDGAELVAAMTQLSPIRDEGVSNYLGEITAGRALYVNDRFMYKTNVVYAGVKIHEVSNLDLANNSASIKFTVWFRWRGTVEPQNVVFTNAVDPIRLDTPTRSGTDGDMNYRAYTVKARFLVNAWSVPRSYGTELVGLSFRHANLSRNNLMYVSDVLGMGLQKREFREQLRQDHIAANASAPRSDGAMGVLSRLLHSFNLSDGGSDAFAAALKQSNILAPLTGWLVDRAWISQEVTSRGSEGDPVFVGFGRPASDFSLLGVTMILKPDAFAAREILSPNAFLLIGLLALAGAVLAMLLDRRDRGQFWRQQTLGLRIVCWPLLLMAASNLSLDYALRHLTTATVDNIVLFFSILWWIVPARLLAVSLERFLWVPLERKTGRRIPNVVRMSSAALIYCFAAFGIIAFVFEKPVTSLLATGGLTAMIIGLAVKGNIANIFSGIVLNIERPFDMGDMVSINKISGQVIDMTWRTTRIQDPAGQIISLPNDKVSEAEIHNMSRARAFRVKTTIRVDPRYDPAVVRALLLTAVSANSRLVRDIADDEPVATFTGIETVEGRSICNFSVGLSVRKSVDASPALQELWLSVWQRFEEAGIEWQQPDGGPPVPANLPALSRSAA